MCAVPNAHAIYSRVSDAMHSIEYHVGGNLAI